MTTRKLLAGTQDSKSSQAALRHAVELARGQDAELHLVGFVGMPKGEAATESYEQDIAAMRRHVQELGERMAADLTTVAHVPTGVTKPSDAILRVAKQEQVDEIVIGLRRRSRVGKLVLGSNAQDILLGAECPVIAVKGPE